MNWLLLRASRRSDTFSGTSVHAKSEGFTTAEVTECEKNER